MEDRLSGVQEVLDGFRKKLDDIHKALHEQKQYDMGVRMDAMKAELQGRIDLLARDVLALQSRSAGPGTPVSAPAPIKPA